MIELPSYPARPTNGGALSGALPKVGLWYAEPKFDGWRAFVHRDTGTMFNRHGELLSIPSEFREALAVLRDTFPGRAFEWLDVEALARRHKAAVGSLIVLDAPFCGGTYSDRRTRLICALYPISVSELNGLEPESVVLTPSWINAHELYAQLLEIAMCEGIVCKKADSIYPIQLQSPDKQFPYWIKHRFR